MQNQWGTSQVTWFLFPASMWVELFFAYVCFIISHKYPHNISKHLVNPFYDKVKTWEEERKRQNNNGVNSGNKQYSYYTSWQCTQFTSDELFEKEVEKLPSDNTLIFNVKRIEELVNKQFINNGSVVIAAHRVSYNWIYFWDFPLLSVLLAIFSLGRAPLGSVMLYQKLKV